MIEDRDPNREIDPREHERLCAYLLGECDPEELASIERLLSSSAALAREHQRLERTIGLLRKSFSGEQAALGSAALAQVRATAARVATGGPGASGPGGDDRWRRKIFSAAAAVLLAAGAIAAYRLTIGGPQSPDAGGEIAVDSKRAKWGVPERHASLDRAASEALDAAAAEPRPTAAGPAGDVALRAGAAEGNGREAGQGLAMEAELGALVMEDLDEERAVEGEPKDLHVLDHLGYSGAPAPAAEAAKSGEAKVVDNVEAMGNEPASPGAAVPLADAALPAGIEFRGLSGALEARERDLDEELFSRLVLERIEGKSAVPTGRLNAGWDVDRVTLVKARELRSLGLPAELVLDALVPAGDEGEKLVAGRLAQPDGVAPAESGDAAAEREALEPPHGRPEVSAARAGEGGGGGAGASGDLPASADGQLGEELGVAPNFRFDGDKLADALLAECRLRPGETPVDMFFRFFGDNAWETAQLDAHSTFAIDVDTASYTLARAYLSAGYLPAPEQVRTEEFVNYFDAGVEPPVEGAFAIDLELAPSPFGADADAWLLRVVVSGKVVPPAERPPLHLTFVVDKSGSMREGGRMELVQAGMRLLVSNLDERDGLAIVAFDEAARLVLPMTSAVNRATILESIAGLVPDGSTNAAAGLSLGYAHAADNLRTDGGVNRVVLLSDGVANTGETDEQAILDSVQSHRAQGIYLNTVGVGLGNHDDALLERLADDGDGIAAYVDDELEARKHLVEDFVQTTVPIARDAKIQVAFDPRQVERYRLLGYENRAVADEDFRDDEVDAGELNSGHQVTALYELVRISTGPDPALPIATARLRFKVPHESGAPGEVTEIEAAIGARDASGSFEGTELGFQRAAIVAQLAELLRKSVHARGETVAALMAQARRVAQSLADASLADPAFDELLALIERAGALLAAEAGDESELARALEAVRERAWRRAVSEEVRNAAGNDRFLDAAGKASEDLDAETRALEQRLRELIVQEVEREQP